MVEPTPLDRPALEAGGPRNEPPSAGASPVVAPPAGQPPPAEGSPTPVPPWRPWTAPAALFAGLVLALLGGLVIDIPAVALGVKVSTSHTPPGVAIANTLVLDIAFVLAAVYFAHLGGRAVSAWQFGLRAPTVRWRSAVGMI